MNEAPLTLHAQRVRLLLTRHQIQMTTRLICRKVGRVASQAACLMAAVVFVCGSGLILSMPTAVHAEVKTVSIDDLEANQKHIRTAKLIQYHINRSHYRNLPLDDALSSEILRRFVESLDGNRIYFTEKDIRRFNHYHDKLDESLKNGELSAPFEIYRTFRQRVAERVTSALQHLNEDLSFKVDENYEFDRTESDWAEDKSALDDIWRRRVKNDLLALNLAEGGTEDPKKTLQRRYERIDVRVKQQTADDVFASFINAYARAIEPHTQYFPPRVSENFRIRMSLSLEGIGAVLQSENEHTVVRRIVPGGPADKGGDLKAGDRITGVGQSDEDVVDVVGWRLDDVVDLIRGPKNTIVNLRVLAKASGEEAKAKVVSITRDKIKLEEQAAQSSVIETQVDKVVRRIGVIDLDQFYIDFDARAMGDKNYRSTTRDVKNLLKELQADGAIDGLIIDLRGNAGGSLSEATSLTGLFIPSGPIVQVQDSSGRLQINEDPDPELVYAGPLAVLVDRESASASEIFAGAIQDYNRGLIIGEPTYGKGTVQNLLDLNRHSMNNEKLGQLKVTIAQFFRVDGGSTQKRGVVPDILLPTARNSDEYGERATENALPWSTVSAARFKANPALTDDKVLGRLMSEHSRRTKDNAGFNYLMAEIDAQQEALDRTTISLLESERRQEIEDADNKLLERLNTYRGSVGLEKIDDAENADDGLEEDSFADHISKVVLREAANILSDLIVIEAKTMAYNPKNASDSNN